MSMGKSELQPICTMINDVERNVPSPTQSAIRLARTNQSLIQRLYQKDREILALKEKIAKLEANEKENGTFTLTNEKIAKNSIINASPPLSNVSSSSLEVGSYGSTNSQPFNQARRTKQLTTEKKKGMNVRVSPPMIPSPKVDHEIKKHLRPSILQDPANNRKLVPQKSHSDDESSGHFERSEMRKQRHMTMDNCQNMSMVDENTVQTDYKNLFKPNLIIEFAEDSPSFRRKVETLEQNVEGLRGHLQQLVNTSRDYCLAGKAFFEQGREFSRTLTNMQGKSWFSRLGVLSPALVRFGETLDEIQTSLESLVYSLESTFSAPMEEFVKQEVRSVIKMKQEVNKSREEFEAQQGKLLQLKRNSDEPQYQIRAAEVAQIKRRFELGRFDLVNHLNQLETKKKFQLVERVCAGLYAFLGYFHQCHSHLSLVLPKMKDLQSAVNLARKDFNKNDRLWAAKRMQLESKLNKQAGAVGGLLNNIGGNNSIFGVNAIADRFVNSSGMRKANNTQRNCGENDSIEGTRSLLGRNSLGGSSDEDDHCNLSTDSGAEDVCDQTRITTESASHQPIKSGYLWKRSTNVRRDWKRRYFFIKGGRLYYERQELSESHPVLVCDIQLCTVRSCEKGSDLRFSFEIISPKQRTYLLQAEDDISHQSWMDAIRGEIAHLLSKDSSPKITDKAYMRNQIPPNDFFRKLYKINPYCVDCGMENPDWASINLGIMMCIECSGIHRSMGVHISKVRSIRLDIWNQIVLQFIEGVGNEKFNKVWEADISTGPPKPSSDSTTAVREKFILYKYQKKGFIGPKMHSLDACRKLYYASRHGDMEGVLKAFAHGADLNWANKDEKYSTPAHQAALGGYLAILELLSQNGASLDSLQDDDITPLDIAMEQKNQDIIALLVSKLEKEQMSRERSGLTTVSTMPSPARLGIVSPLPNHMPRT